MPRYRVAFEVILSYDFEPAIGDVLDLALTKLGADRQGVATLATVRTAVEREAVVWQPIARRCL